MKKICAVIALFAVAVGAKAQDGTSRSNAIKVNIFSPIAKTGSFFYERKVTESSSAQLGVGFTAYNRENIKISGIFFTPEYRFYLSNNGEALNGFYVGPYVRYQNLTIEENEDPNAISKATLSTFGGGVAVGRQWVFGNIVTLDVFLGPNYNSGKLKIKQGDDIDVPGSFQGFGLRFGTTLGIAF
ncbi:MAG TPA: DUF3575 domain-containing protein [Flavisolibacter sp.]|nr:DUF3575 domain-containing protein [Flavisolibacter sp.]